LSLRLAVTESLGKRRVKRKDLSDEDEIEKKNEDDVDVHSPIHLLIVLEAAGGRARDQLSLRNDRRARKD
jgi:hypothetical protein